MRYLKKDMEAVMAAKICKSNAFAEKEVGHLVDFDVCLID